MKKLRSFVSLTHVHNAGRGQSGAKCGGDVVLDNEAASEANAGSVFTCYQDKKSYLQIMGNLPNICGVEYIKAGLSFSESFIIIIFNVFNANVLQ